MNLLNASIFPVPPEGVALWLYLTCVIAGVLVIGIAKSGFGGALGILAVPLFALALPTTQAVGIMLPMLMACDWFALYHHRRQRPRPVLRYLLIGAVLGVLAGTAALILFDTRGQLETALNLSVGSICLLLVLLQVYRVCGGVIRHVPTGAGGGVLTGGIAGTLSTISHGAGPLISIYLLERREPKTGLVVTAIWFFLLLNTIKVPTYVGMGLITWTTLKEAAWLLPAVPIGSALGIYLHHRIAEKPFVLVMYAATALAAGHMIYKVF